MGVRKLNLFPGHFQSQLWEPGPFTQNSSYLNVWDRQEPSILTKKLFPPRVHWFARHGKQATPGKTSAKATLVSGDTVDGVLQMQTGLGSFSLGVKLTSGWVFVCTHWVAEEKPGMAKAKLVWALPAWPLCSFLPGLGRCPRRLLPLVSSPVEYFCSTFFWRKTACHCGFAVDPTSCLVSPNSETLQKATEWAGDCFLGREPQVWSATVRRSNWIYAQDLLLCVLGGRHILSPRLQVYTQTHTFTSTFKFSGKGS